MRLFNPDGSVAVDPVKCPTLYRSLVRARANGDSGREGWNRVVELRKTGEADSADRLVRKLLGVQGPPMSEETKEKLRVYNEEHNEEIKARREQRLNVRLRTLALLHTGSKR